MSASDEASVRARSLLETSYRHTDSGDPLDAKIATHTALQGIGYALLALIPLVREIGDQLDRIPRALRCDEVNRLGQRCVRRIGHEGHHSAGWSS